MPIKRIAPGEKSPLNLTPNSTKFPVKITQHQRESLLLYTRLKAVIKKRLQKVGEGTQVIKCTKQEIDHMQDEISQAVVYARSPHKQRLVAIQKKVDDILDEIQLEEFDIEQPKQRRQSASRSNMLIQLKVILLEVVPTIWRRIHIKDCTLGELHEHIQLAMGWENCHMHQFTIEGEQYGTAISDDLDIEMEDESQVRLSDVIPASGKRFRFRYEYDFGDGWKHEVLFEGYPPMEEGQKLPHCIEGERACPPEDIGGPWGYAEYLDALNDSDHERHDEFMEWGGSFDPQDFSTEKATKALRRGLH